MGNYRKRLTLGDRGLFISLFILSATSFLFEVTLTRLFAIAYFYHFAFLVISVALLGNGISGSFLSVHALSLKTNLRQRGSGICAGGGLSILGAYLIFNRLPFDVYAVAIDTRQIGLFILQLTAFSMPFFFNGLYVNILMKVFPRGSHQVYAFNLGGSAVGCLLAPLLLPVLGGEGAVLLCISLAALSGLIVALSDTLSENGRQLKWGFKDYLILVLCIGMLGIVLPEITQRCRGKAGNPIFNLYISPYKSLSYALQYPGATIAATRWNSFSRVDMVTSKGIRSLPGLSYLYPHLVDVQAGLFVDGDNLSPVLPLDTNAELFSYLPQSLAFQLRPSASALILEPRGGLDLLAAQAGGARKIIAVEANSLLVDAASEIYRQSNIETFIESPRSFLHQGNERYEVILYSLANSYYPVSAGVYSLSEDYVYTLESLENSLSRLDANGLLVLCRWIQVPPSEFLRTFILAVNALENIGLDPHQHIAALRGYNLGCLYINQAPWNPPEIDQIRTFAASRAFDLVYLPGIRADESNLFNILPRDDYYQTFTGYLDSTDRKAWLAAYPYDVSPPNDNRPFFGHYFKWSQTRQVLASLGKTWQPFGGAGYLLVVFILIAVILISLVLILLPVLVRRRQKKTSVRQGAKQALRWRPPAYFLLLGFGFMAIEVPLIQKFILLLGQPTYSFSVVLFTLLLSSGLGSFFSERMNEKWLLALGVWTCLSPLWLEMTMHTAAGWTLILRLLTVIACLAPLGFLMGIAFPKGIAKARQRDEQLLPWLWAVNGASSVVSSVLCAILAISFGYNPLLIGGGACYLLSYHLLRNL